MTPEEAKDFAMWDTARDLVEANEPYLWRLMYPRIYDNLGKWHTPKIPATMFALQLSTLVRKGMTNMNVATRNHATIGLLLAEHAVPTFFVSKQLLDAINASNPPDDFKWTSIKFPHPGVLFMFEKGAAFHPRDGEISYIAVGRIERDKALFQLPGTQQVISGDSGVLVSSAAHETPGFIAHDLTMADNVSPDFGSIDDISQWDMKLRDSKWDVPLSDADRQWNQWMAVTALKLIMVMEARPEMVSMGEHLRTVKPKRPGEKPREFWSPNILGRNYAAKRDPDYEPGESGIKHRLHWRRGHFTQQPYGPLALNEATNKMAPRYRKTLWREPILIGEIKNDG